MTGIDIGPGEVPQLMHGDDGVMSRHLQRPHAPMMVTSMWALTDFTAANGGTWFVPGSHRRPDVPSPTGELPNDTTVRSLEMSAGSVMVFHGSLWHGGGANTSDDEWRLGVNVQYCPGFVRQQQNPYLGIPRETAEQFSDRLLALLGYRLYLGVMGHIDGLVCISDESLGGQKHENADTTPKAICLKTMTGRYNELWKTKTIAIFLRWNWLCCGSARLRRC